MKDLGLDWVRIAEFSWSDIEPSPGQFRWDWLDEAVATLGDAGLKIMMCTPTASPPKWLVDRYPEILPVGADGNLRKFGSRRHYSFSSETYRDQAVRIAGEFSRRYGSNDYIHAWQIDNEYGDHDTIKDYSDNAVGAFRTWLRKRYGTIDQLNRRWGTSFWSSRYSEFGQVDLPAGQVEEPNPSHALDFCRFSSDQVVAFNKAQYEVIKRHAPGVPVTHNYMANNLDFDHFDLSASTDFASWDSYPMGHLVHGPYSDEQKKRYLRTGMPDYQAFNSELYRAVGNGSVWITEQQPGPVNWAIYNQAPDDGMIRKWTWEAWAHGVDVVMFFRWRQNPKAQEQFHTALLLEDGTPDQAYKEVQQIVRDRKAVGGMALSDQAQVGLVIDYPSFWVSQILPQGADDAGAPSAYEWFQAARQRGVAVDIVGPDVNPENYTLLLCPDLMKDNLDLTERIATCECKVVFNGRSCSKNEDMSIPAGMPPGSIRRLLDVKVTRVESLPAFASDTVRVGNREFPVGSWRESIHTNEAVLAVYGGEYRQGTPAIAGNEQCRYFAFRPRDELLGKLLDDAFKWAGIPTQNIHEDIRVKRRGACEFIFNSGPDHFICKTIPGTDFVIGSERVAPRSVSVRKILD